MYSLSSKHRAVEVSNFQGVEFLVLESVIAKYGVKSFDFVYCEEIASALSLFSRVSDLVALISILIRLNHHLAQAHCVTV